MRFRFPGDKLRQASWRAGHLLNGEKTEEEAMDNPQAAPRTFVYVAAAEAGLIDVYEMDRASGALISIGQAAAGKLVMPMAVSPGKKFLYAIIRSEPFRAVTYAIDPETGALTQKASAPLPDSMCYASVDATGRFLFTASYGGDKIAVTPIGADGLIEAPPFQTLPTGRHAHSVLPSHSNKFVFAACLGADQIMQFNFDAATGMLMPNSPRFIEVRPGHGPRHLAIPRNDKFLYVLNELSGHVSQFAIETATGTLAETDSVGSVPISAGLEPGFPRSPVSGAAASEDETPRIWAADLQITPDSKFLYSTERTHSKIALFAVAPETGKLTYIENYATETQPRGIRIDPAGSFLTASGEKSNRLAVYKIDPVTGKLTEAGRYPISAGANWIEIVQIQ
jgi:6-phosphogluconolactonase